MSDYNFEYESDFGSSDAIANAIANRHRRGSTSSSGYRTSQSQYGPRKSLTTYSLADILQGGAAYRPSAITYDIMNQVLTSDYAQILQASASQGENALFYPGRTAINPGELGGQSLTTENFSRGSSPDGPGGNGPGWTSNVSNMSDIVTDFDSAKFQYIAPHPVPEGKIKEDGTTRISANRRQSTWSSEGPAKNRSGGPTTAEDVKAHADLVAKAFGFEGVLGHWRTAPAVPGSGQDPNSDHYWGGAIDFMTGDWRSEGAGGPRDQMGNRIAEFFAGYCYEGGPIRLVLWKANSAHHNHVHVSWWPLYDGPYPIPSNLINNGRRAGGGATLRPI